MIWLVAKLRDEYGDTPTDDILAGMLGMSRSWVKQVKGKYGKIKDPIDLKPEKRGGRKHVKMADAEAEKKFLGDLYIEKWPKPIRFRIIREYYHEKLGKVADSTIYDLLKRHGWRNPKFGYWVPGRRRG